MWRRLLFTAGDFFDNMVADLGIGLGTTLLVGWAGWGILGGIGVAFAAKMLGVVLIWIAENAPLKVGQSPRNRTTAFHTNAEGVIFVDNYLPLTLRNDEHQPIENLTARLCDVRLENIVVNWGGLTHGAINFPIGWEGVEGGEASIPAHGGETNLLVFVATTCLENGKTAFSYVGFNDARRENADLWISTFPQNYLYSFRIEFRGVMDEKPVRLKDFVGTICVRSNTERQLDTFYIHPGKPTQQEIQDVRQKHEKETPDEGGVFQGTKQGD